ncbi:MAG: hypothetical protein ABFS16_01800 [Bacteroidota bacterium]
MEINRNNYEAYFIDYLEGNLDERLVDIFIEFLQQNPDLKEELSLFEQVRAVPEQISFDKKEKLYKEKYDSEKEFDNAAIASLEGDILEKEKAGFEAYIATHPEKQKDIVLFSKTKLKADESVVFTKKSRLYKKSARKVFLLWSGRVAAVLILALAIFNFMDTRRQETVPDNQVAKFDEKTIKKEAAPEIKKVVPVEKMKNDPVKSDKGDKGKNQKGSVKPEVKQPVPEKKSNKSIRENSKGRMKHEDLAAVRTPVEVPDELEAITATLNNGQPEAILATINLTYPENYYYDDERLLADIIKEKTGINKFNLNKITKAGLNLVTSMSNEKFTYETNKEGKVTEYNYESRLLAFSIPGNKTESE